MKFFRIKFWLARLSERLDKKYAQEFREWNKKTVNKMLENIDLSTKGIYFTKKN